MKIKKQAEHTKHVKHEHENAKHLQDATAKKLAEKHPRGTFFGQQRWFPYNINE